MLKMVKDERMHGVTRYFLAENDHLMRIPDFLKNCAVFVAAKGKTGSLRFMGTAFFYVLQTDTDKGYPYLVTAKHVIEKTAEDGIDNKVHLRVNLKSGGHRTIETEYSQWCYDEGDETIDIAVLPLDESMLGGDVEMVFIESRSGMSEQMIRMEGFGLGDDTFIIGLYAPHAGKQKNIPIVRMGTIAAMPEEKVEAKNFDIDAYLVEIRSRRGLSGSPVFVHSTRRTWYETITEQYPTNRAGIIVFLGVVHGHFSGGTTEDAIEEDAGDNDAMNHGIAMVIPSDKILHVLNLPPLKELRDKLDQQRRKSNGAVED